MQAADVFENVSYINFSSIYNDKITGALNSETRDQRSQKQKI